MKLYIKSKYLYLLALVVVCLLGIVVMPTYAKFGEGETFDNVVGINLDYNIGISNIDQFEEIVLEAGESTSFNVNVTNSSGELVYYGIWYKMVNPSSMPSDDSIQIGKLEGTNISTSGSIENGGEITSTIGLINNTSEEIKIYLGVASSSTSTNDIEYINGKYLISGTVTIINGVTEATNFATYIKNLYNSSRATTVNIGGDTTKPTVGLVADSSIMLDNNGEYRYYGKNPNNYVSFNGELWRVISVSNVKSSESDTVGSMRVRIIRDESIGNHSWNYSGTNNWETATLNATLNGIYYNGTSGTCYIAEYAGFTGTASTCDYASGTIKGLSSEARSLIDDAVWYLGGSSDSEGLYASDYYTFERGLPDGYTLPGSDYPETVTTKLGIMYPSDYTYAADLSVCTKDGFNYYTDTTNCTGTDWLFNSDYHWLISPFSSGSPHAFYVNSSGYVDGIDYGTDFNVVSNAIGVRPVAVLKSDVKVYGGSGTSDDPYLLQKPVVATEKIESLYNDGSSINTVNIGGDTTKPTVSLNATQGIMLDNNGEYRYYGKNPNNYVSFNGELWRIISSSNVKTNAEDTTGSQRLRIIRAESIGYHAWNYNGTNNWETATLNTTLNGIYYDGTSGTCYLDGSETTCDYSEAGSGTIKGLSEEARSLIDDAVWYLGGSSIYEGLYASDYYTFERGTTVYEGNPTSTTAKLGIMYPSDYAYAADLSVCTKPVGYTYDSSTSSQVDYSSDTTNCTGTDWLFNSNYQWLISPHSVDLSYAFRVYSSGYVDSHHVLAHGVRPLAVLRSNVTITGGGGTSDSPYTLSVQ